MTKLKRDSVVGANTLRADVEIDDATGEATHTVEDFVVYATGRLHKIKRKNNACLPVELMGSYTDRNQATKFIAAYLKRKGRINEDVIQKDDNSNNSGQEL